MAREVVPRGHSEGKNGSETAAKAASRPMDGKAGSAEEFLAAGEEPRWQTLTSWYSVHSISKLRPR